MVSGFLSKNSVKAIQIYSWIRHYPKGSILPLVPSVNYSWKSIFCLNIASEICMPAANHIARKQHGICTYNLQYYNKQRKLRIQACPMYKYMVEFKS